MVCELGLFCFSSLSLSIDISDLQPVYRCKHGHDIIINTGMTKPCTFLHILCFFTCCDLPHAVISQSFSMHPADQLDVIQGTNISFSIIFTGGSSPVYSWVKDEVQITDPLGKYQGLDTNTLTILNVEEADEGNYQAIVIDNVTFFSNTAELTVCK